jgi:hypothetical protein
MWLVRSALRNPYLIVVMALTVIIIGITAVELLARVRRGAPLPPKGDTSGVGASPLPRSRQ